MYDSVLMLSGGLDSSVLAFSLKKQGRKFRCLYFDLGAFPSPREIHSARKISFDLEVPLEIIELNGIVSMMRGYVPHAQQGADELDTGSPTPIPDSVSQHHAKKYVSGFHILMSVADYYAHITGINQINLAVVRDQLDQRESLKDFFIEYQKSTRLLNSELPEVALDLPFAGKYKRELILKGQELQLPFDDSWSCYYGHEEHCGHCHGCSVRKQAFRDASVEDPTIYLDDKK